MTHTEVKKKIALIKKGLMNEVLNLYLKGKLQLADKLACGWTDVDVYINGRKLYHAMNDGDYQEVKRVICNSVDAPEITSRIYEYYTGFKTFPRHVVVVEDFSGVVDEIE